MAHTHVHPNLAAGDEPYTRPFQHPELPAGESWGHQPTHHNGEYVDPGHAVLMMDGHQWPHQPETCQYGWQNNQWYFDGLVLACLGCGLDGS